MLTFYQKNNKQQKIEEIQDTPYLFSENNKLCFLSNSLLKIKGLLNYKGMLNSSLMDYILGVNNYE